MSTQATAETANVCMTLGTKHILSRGREDKLTLTAAIFRRYLSGSVLDVGCDQKFLQQFVGGNYVGVDMLGMPDVLVNVENGMPFLDRSFDTVLSMDNLEHVENIHFLFDDICRVSRKFVIVALPNLYEWRFRLRFLFRKKISGKYGLPLERPIDRHRWLFSLTEARTFVKERGERNGYLLVDEMLGYYKYANVAAKGVTSFGRMVCPRAKDFFADRYFAVLERQTSKVVLRKNLT